MSNTWELLEQYKQLTRSDRGLAAYLVLVVIWALTLGLLVLAALGAGLIFWLTLLVAGLAILLLPAAVVYGAVRRRLAAVDSLVSQLQEKEAQLDQLAEHVHQVFWITSSDRQHVVYTSPTCERICGQSCETLDQTGGCWTKFVHPEDRDRIMVTSTQPVTAEYEQEYRLVQPSGQICWVRERIFPLSNEQGEIYRVCGITQEITDQVLNKQALEKFVEERTHELARRKSVAEGLRDILRALNSDRSLESVLDLIVVQASRLLEADAVAIYHLEKADLLTVWASHGLPGDYLRISDIPTGQGVTGRTVQTRQPVLLTDFKAQDGAPTDSRRRERLNFLAKHFCSLLAVPLIVKERVYGAITLYYCQRHEFDDDEIKLAVAFSDQAALAIENARLREQVEQNAVLAERHRIARDLHDSVSQTLFSASLVADVLPTVWKMNPTEAAGALEELRQLTRGALAEMRTLLLELRPSALTKADLNTLLQQLAEAANGRSRVPVEVSISGQCAIPHNLKLALYRITQEALHNVVKHAGAKRAKISLECLPPQSQGELSSVNANEPSAQPGSKQIVLKIQDNGRGFDPSKVTSDHLGLAIMRERAEDVGGRLTITSRPGQGTEVSLVWENEDSWIEEA